MVKNGEKREGIAIAGNIIVDIVNMIDKYPEKNMLCNISSSSSAVGGCVCNTIIDIAKIDPEMSLSAIGKIGNDENGKFILSEFAKYGVDSKNVKIDDAINTSCDHVMTEITTGARTFFYSSGANSTFGIEDIDIDALDCKIFHAGYILLLDALDAADDEYGTKFARLLHDVSAKGIKTSIDVVSEDGERFKEKIIPALKYSDYAILNEIESCRVTGLSPRHEDGRIHVENIKATMEKFIECGVREKVIVHCTEAGFLLDKDGNFVVVPSLELPNDYIKGSVGAGDSYAAACLYGIYKEYESEELLEFAAAAAACNLSEADSISGMRSKEEIDELNKKFNIRVLD